MKPLYQASKLNVFPRSNSAPRSKNLGVNNYGLTRSRKCVYYENGPKVEGENLVLSYFFRSLCPRTSRKLHICYHNFRALPYTMFRRLFPFGRTDLNFSEMKWFWLNRMWMHGRTAFTLYWYEFLHQDENLDPVQITGWPRTLPYQYLLCEILDRHHVNKYRAPRGGHDELIAVWKLYQYLVISPLCPLQEFL